MIKSPAKIKQFKDSDGKIHYMYQQKDEYSCTIASMFIIDNAMHLSTNHGGQKRIQAAAGIKDEEAGSAASILKAAHNLGISFTKCVNFNTYIDEVNFEIDRISELTPALVTIRWRSFGLPNGGHAVVAARVTSANKIVILDPWEPALREIDASGGKYQDSGHVMGIYYTA